MARGRRPHAAPPGPGLGGERWGGEESAAPGPRRTLPLAVPPLTPIRKGSPPLGCWWFCRVCSLSPAMARPAPPPAACANGRTLPARAGLPPLSRSLRWALPRSRLTRLPAHCSDPGAGAGFPEGSESLPLPAAAAPVYIPGRGQRDAAAPIRADSALLFAEAAAARRLPQPPPLPGPAAAAAWGLWERYEPDPSPNPPG